MITENPMSDKVEKFNLYSLQITLITYLISILRSDPPSAGLIRQFIVLLMVGQFTVSMTLLLNQLTRASEDR